MVSDRDWFITPVNVLCYILFDTHLMEHNVSGVCYTQVYRWLVIIVLIVLIVICFKINSCGWDKTLSCSNTKAVCHPTLIKKNTCSCQNDKLSEKGSRNNSMDSVQKL